ncbi:hypothetical protein [Gracilimonas sp.]|uniref:hypothetical protein n=1 Tax=Gracilimonas sp. TaxID=1974203 RepID=UPI0032F096CA
MRYIFSFIVFALVTGTAFSQSLRISESSSTQGNNTNQFTVAGHQIDLNNSSLSFSSGAVSSDLNDITALSSALNNSGVTVFEGAGEELYSSSSYKLQSDDNSVKVYVKPNGGFIVRENIANFLFFDESGKIEQSVSNSSQSTEGESVSELAADPAFKTVVLYNPKIVRDQIEGSRARIVKPNWTTSDIFYSGDRPIRFVKVSENGQFIAVVSYKDGEDDMIDVMDRFGNELETISFNQTIADVRFSEDGEFLTVRSNSRVGVYSVLDGEREGSTSFRSMLHFAEYVPQDNTIIALTGDESGSVLSGIEFHAINIEARAIERQDYNSSLGISELLSLSLKRTGSNSYSLTGLSKALNLSVSF